MYKVEKNEKYKIQYNKSLRGPLTDLEYKSLITYCGAPKQILIMDEPILEFICEDFKDVLRYFANHYNNIFGIDELKFKTSDSYISMCQVVDKYNRIVYPNIYTGEIMKLIKNNDLEYVSKFVNYRFDRDYPHYSRTNELKFIPSYKFRKDSVPYTGKSNYDSWHIVKYYDVKNFEIDRDELDEMEINYYLPIQKKREVNSGIKHEDKFRHYDQSWKTSFKCKKQWMKHKKGCKPYDKRQYDMEYEEEFHID